MNLADALRRFKDQQLAGGEAALSIGSSMLAEPIAGLSGIGTLMMGGGMDAAANNVNAMREMATYQPNDPSALQALGESAPMSMLGKVMQDYQQGNQTRGKMAQDAGAGPGLSTLASMAPDIAMGLVSLPARTIQAGLSNAARAGGPGGFAGSAQFGRVGTKSTRNVKPPKAGRTDIPVAAREYTPDELRLMAIFNTKAAREKALARKVERGTTAKVEKKSQGKRAAVDPLEFRKLEQLIGPEKALEALRRGKHLRPAASGGWVGAPRTVQNRDQLRSLRKSLDQQFEDAAFAIGLADPARLGTWYDRAKEGIMLSTTPAQRARALEEHAVYSAGVAPEAELGFALKHRNSRAFGQPEMAYRGAPMRTLDEAVMNAVDAKLGHKISEYRSKNDPSIPNTGLFGVNDFRAAQGFDYTNPSGGIWKGGVSDTMHPFMDGETALIGDRANLRGVGGRTDWQGPHVQELPWVLAKAQDFYRRGSKKGRYKGDPVEGMKRALRDANNTAQDYFYKHAASMTSEAIPGAKSGHVPSALDMTPEQKLAYTKAGRWDQPVEGAPGYRDSIYDAIGLRQLPTADSTGIYANKLGGLEFNDMTITRPLASYPTGGTGELAPMTEDVFNAAELFRGTNDAQEVAAWHHPNSMNAVTGKDAFVLDTRGQVPGADPALGIQPTAEQLFRLKNLLKPTGYEPTASGRGVVIANWENGNPKMLAEVMKKYAKEINEIYPSNMMKARISGNAMDIPHEPFSGRATTAVLERFAKVDQKIADAIGESPQVRNAITGKIERDAALPYPREDIQNMRRFFADPRWPKAVALMKKGMKPAAALASLGFSMGAMAEEK